MKLGYTALHKNEMLPPHCSARTHEICMPDALEVYPMLYPDDLFAWVNPLEPDLDICSELDVLLHWTGYPDSKFVDWMDEIPCKIVCVHNSGPFLLLHDVATQYDVLLRKEIMNKSDLVMSLTREHIQFYKLWTETPVFYMPTPYPIELALSAVNTLSEDVLYDIVIPHGLHKSGGGGNRNSLTAALVARKIIDEVEGFESARMFCSETAGCEYTAELLTAVGCEDIMVSPRIDHAEFVRALSGAKMGLSLDMSESAGKIAIDCACLRKPAVLANTTPYAVEIYEDIRIQHPFDVDAAIETARMVVDGRWSKEWLDKAERRAGQYNIGLCAERLERAVAEIEE